MKTGSEGVAAPVQDSAVVERADTDASRTLSATGKGVVSQASDRSVAQHQSRLRAGAMTPGTSTRAKRRPYSACTTVTPIYPWNGVKTLGRDRRGHGGNAGRRAEREGVGAAEVTDGPIAC